MRPLEGLKIIDLSRVLAGPFCTQIFGDLGAEVLKIESPEGDDTRRWTPPDFEGQSVYYLSANRNKKILRADFRNREDLDKVRRLLKDADICVENFKTDSLKKFDLDYDSLRKINPRLICASITGFGQTGPYAHKPGYDLLIQAMGGMMSVTGSDVHDPTKVGVAIIDIATGLYAAIGILAAVHARNKTGHGDHIDIALMDVSAALLSYLAMNFLVTKKSPEPMGNAHPTIVPYQVFQTKDRPLLLTIGSDAQFKSLCVALGNEWYNDSRFTSNHERERHRDEIVRLIENRLKERPRDEWLTHFEKFHFPFGPLNNLEEVAKDPQVIARHIFTTMSDGKTPCIASPLRFKNAEPTLYKAPLNQGAEDG